MMMRLTSITTLLVFSVLACESCTLIMVGKNASSDGSVMVAHTDDAGGGASDLRLVKVPSADWPEGTLRPVYKFQDGYPRVVTKDRGNGYYPREGQNETLILGYIPQVRHTYAYVDQDYGLMNEEQLIIAETTTSSKTAGWPLSDPWGKAMFGIDELSKVALERCDSARCAIQLMGDLAYKYGFWSADSGDPKNPGYADSSETLGIGDKHGEVWVFHVLTGLNGSSAIWAAQRIPDDHLAVSANSFIIRSMNLSDTDNYLASPNIHSAALDAGWWDPAQEFDFFKCYGFGTVEDVLSSLYTGRRSWRVMDVVAPSQRFDPYWGMSPDRASYPFSVKPDSLITLRQVMNILRDHYEGTEFDMAKQKGAGPFGIPIRWDGSPKGVKGGWERVISIYRTTFSFVAQARPHLPNEVGALAWYGHDTPNGTVYMPIYASQTEMPRSFGKGKMSEFDTDSAWWAFNFVNNWRLIRFDAMTQDILLEQQRLEEHALKQYEHVEKHALEYCSKQKCERSKAVEILTNFSVENADYVVKSWWSLAWKLVAKYTNGYITTGEKSGEQHAPGYPAWWLEQSEFSSWPGKTYYLRDQEPEWGIHLPPGKKWEEKVGSSDGSSTKEVLPSKEAERTGSAWRLNLGSFIIGSVIGGVVVATTGYAFLYQRKRQGYQLID